MTLDLAALRQRLQLALGEEFTAGPLLGQGGFAAVFRARDHSLHRDVAVKVLDLEVAPSPTLAERFLREAQTIAQLEHPHIVPIYKVGKHGDTLLYIVMRCIDGPSLRQLLATHQRLSVGDAARIARQVADALGYAHSHGVVHRDVKPDNILLDKQGHVLVTDFGIAKAARAVSATGAELTTEGMIIGTPQYMSPEQSSGEQVDGRSDIYALGIVLYQMLAGAPPFDGPSSASILAKQLSATPEPMRRHRGDVPPSLVATLDRMLAKDPAQRYQAAADVSRALVEALPSAAHDRIKAPLRRRLFTMALKSLVGLGVAGCIAFIAFAAGAVFVFWAVLSEPPRYSLDAPVPDSVVGSLRERGGLAPDDTAQYVFAPDGPLDSILFVVAQRRVAIVRPHRARDYPRDSVAYTYDVQIRGGLQIRFILILPGERRDTVYPNMSPRAAFIMAQRLDGLLPADSLQGPGIKINTELPGSGPVRLKPD